MQRVVDAAWGVMVLIPLNSGLVFEWLWCQRAEQVQEVLIPLNSGLVFEWLAAVKHMLENRLNPFEFRAGI